MRREPPIAVCAYGWRQELRLYANALTIGGTDYALRDLTHIRPVYQHVMGIASVRLELCFGRRKLTLRGIADVEEARKVVAYLTSHYLGFAQPVQSAQLAQTYTGLSATKGWSRTRERALQETSAPGTPQPAQEIALSEQLDTFDLSPLPALSGSLSQSRQPDMKDFCLQTFAQAPTAKVAAPNWQRFRQEQRERRQRRLHVERSLREHGFDVEQLAQRLKEEALPEVRVPIRLLMGEAAHYSTDATLCDEPISGAMRYTYPAKEHGTLILTNKRLVYIGRKSQIVLDYGRLLHVSRLRGAIAFQAEHWYKREIFEVPRSLECIMFLEHILAQYQQTQRFQDMQEIQRVSAERPVASRYVQFHSHVEEAPVAVDINTMPLSQQPWGLAEVIDSMDR